MQQKKKRSETKRKKTTTTREPDMEKLGETGKLLLDYGVSYYSKHHKRTTGSSIAKSVGKYQTEINRVFGNLENFWTTVEAEYEKRKEAPQGQPRAKYKEDYFPSRDAMAEIDSEWRKSVVGYPELKYVDFSPSANEQTLVAYATIGDRYVFSAASTPNKWDYNTSNAIDHIIRSILVAENVGIEKIPKISFYDFRTRIGWDNFMPGYYELYQVKLGIGVYDAILGAARWEFEQYCPSIVFDLFKKFHGAHEPYSPEELSRFNGTRYVENMHAMALIGTTESVVKLFREGHDVNTLTESGESVLDFALSNRRKKNVRFLRNKGAQRGKALRAAA